MKWFFLLIPLIISNSSFAGIYDVPKVTTVQNRFYYLKNEITLNTTYLPLDPYIKYLGLGGSYTRHFSNFTSWEILNGAVANKYDSGLKGDLITGFNADPKSFNLLKYYYSSNLVLTPLYSKILFFNSSIIYQMTSFVAGFGVGAYELNGESEMRQFVNVGGVLHFFLSHLMSMKVDIRDQIYLSGSRNMLTITLGFAFNFGSDDSEKEDVNEFQ